MVHSYSDTLVSGYSSMKPDTLLFPDDLQWSSSILQPLELHVVDIHSLAQLSELFWLLPTYILKAKKFAEPFFQSKKFMEKVRKSGRHFWAIWGNCGPFWVIVGQLWITLGHSRAVWGHLGSYLGHFGKIQKKIGPLGARF